MDKQAFINGYMQKESEPASGKKSSNKKPSWLNAPPDEKSNFKKQERKRLSRAAAAGNNSRKVTKTHLRSPYSGDPHRFAQAEALGKLPVKKGTPRGKLNGNALYWYDALRSLDSPAKVFEALKDKGFDQKSLDYIKNLVEQGYIQASLPNKSKAKPA